MLSHTRNCMNKLTGARPRCQEDDDYPRSSSSYVTSSCSSSCSSSSSCYYTDEQIPAGPPRRCGQRSKCGCGARPTSTYRPNVEEDSYGRSSSVNHQSAQRAYRNQQAPQQYDSAAAMPQALELEYSDGYTESSDGKNPEHYHTSDILAQHQANLSAVSAPPNASMIYEVRRQFTPHIAVGPVIGLVTETTARILVECSDNCEVKCYLTDASGTQHGVAMQCPKDEPVVFAFDELAPGTLYRVNFDVPVPGVVQSRFKTLASDWSSKEHSARFAVVSGNDLAAARDTVPEESDLWKKLYTDNKKQSYDYCLHLGSVVFVDSKDYIDTKRDGRVPNEKNNSAFQDALDLAEVNASRLGEIEGEILDKFRNVYRDTWNQPTVRHALANIPNLMICGAMELGQSFYAEDDEDECRVLVQRCAYKIYNEYCRALFEDLKPASAKPAKISQAYHFHALGDIGVLFIDTKAHLRFHRSKADHYEVPFLGKRQWNDLDYALSEAGYLSLCKVLLVCSASPMAQVSEAGWLAAGNAAKLDLAETWNTPSAVSEASLLLAKLFDWKNRQQGVREVVVLGGSLTDAGLTVISDNRYERGIDKIYQLTAGAISTHTFSGPASLSNAGMSRGIGVYHTFKHKKIYKTRAYATIQVERDPEHGDITLSATHVVANGLVITTVPHQL